MMKPTGWRASVPLSMRSQLISRFGYAALYSSRNWITPAPRLSVVLHPNRPNHDSGEINSEVADQEAAIRELTRAHADGELDRLDGLTVSYEDWWFNIRPSNTEPLLRLNLEARTRDLVDALLM
jgi:CubicO group peptidase (beta-lactamase class C family)